MTADYPLVPYRDAHGFIVSRVALIAPQVVPLADALGKPLGERLIAVSAVPPYPIAGRKGIAVASRDLIGASPYSPAVMASRPALVMPGDRLPPPTDAVLEEHAVASSSAAHEIGQCAYPGEGAVLPGADCPQGAEIAAEGATVTPAVRLALSLCGVTAAAIRSPIVHLGNPDGTAPAETAWLQAMLVEAGCRPVTDADGDLRILVTRDPHGVAAALGGVVIGGVALNPGRDTLIGWADGRITVVVAARFDAVAGVFLALILPAIAKMTGRRLRLIDRPLAGKLVAQVGFADVALLRNVAAGYDPLATGTLSLNALISADAVGIVAPESEGAPSGSSFPATPTKDPFEVP